jgi:hypothetical protein
MSSVKINGFVDDRFAPVKEAFESNFTSGQENGAGFCMTVDGKTVVDIWGGYADEAQTRPWERDTIVNVYSTTKTMTALTALYLADKGALDFAAPVSKYWPEFAANGKADVTVAHLMSHSAGLSGWKEPLVREDLYDWEKATSLLAAQAPYWKPGTAPGYHAMTQGYLVGEVIRRVAGETVGTVFAQTDRRAARRGLPHRPSVYGGPPGCRPDASASPARGTVWAGHADELQSPTCPNNPPLQSSGHAHARLARRRDPGRRRHGQCPLGCSSCSPCSPTGGAP